MKFKEFIRKYWREIVLVIISALFFVAVGSFNRLTQDYAQAEGGIDFVKWLSPDETSNYIFTKLYAQTGNLTISEDYNLKTKDIMHPRSFRSDHGILKPVSFLGIILIYGKIASFFGYQVIPYLTPFFASLGIFFFYLLVKRLFDRNIAFISALLLAVFPAYTYYSARSMFHNVLMVDMLTIGAYFGMLMVSNRSRKDSREETNIKLRSDWLGMLFASLSGFFVGLGIISRASELLWIAPSLFIIWIFNIRKIGFVRLALFISFLFLAILPNLYYNQILYGSPIAGGYNEMNESLRNITSASKGIVTNAIESGEAGKHKEQLELIKQSIFHFGIHPRQSLRMMGHYFVEMFYYIFWPAVAGFLIFFGIQIFNTKKRHWIYLLCIFFTSFILIIYYGSWNFHDNPDPNSFTIGNSYTRYWLPVYLGSFPFVAVLIVGISNVFVWLKKKIVNKFHLLQRGNVQTGEHSSNSQDEGDLGKLEKTNKSNSFVSAFVNPFKVMRRFKSPTPIGAPPLKKGEWSEENDASSLEEREIVSSGETYSFWKKFFSLNLRDSLLKFAVQAVFVMAIFFLSIQFVLFGSEEGIIYAVQKQLRVRTEWARVIELTPHNSTLITRYHDKLFFPERKVIVGEFADKNMVAEYRNLANYLPVYYYNFTLPPASVKWLNEKRLGEVGLGIELVEKITKDFSLYKLYLDDTYYVKPVLEDNSLSKL